MMAESPAVITLPQNKKGKVKKGGASTALVLSSLAPTLPIVMPEVAAHLEESAKSTSSAPTSPEREAKKKGFLKKHLPRPKSPSRQRRASSSHSDPESPGSSPSPQPRPRWLPFKNKKRRSPGLNGETSSSQEQEEEEMVTGSYKPEATPVDELPGRIHSNSCPNVPEIRVSSEGQDGFAAGGGGGGGGGGLVSFEEISGSLDPTRKNSQSSRCSSGSGLMSVGTSGIGSCLSPSGDESDPESPLSPYSPMLSFNEDASGSDASGASGSDTDPIDRDYKSPPSITGSADNLSVATPTPTSESPPRSEEVMSPTSPTSSDKNVKLAKKKQKNKVSLERECC